jgi:ketosteroid isomerase-like protein
MLPIDLAEAFVAAIESGDRPALERMMADDCIVHANFTGTDNDRATTLRILRWLQRNVSGFRYEIVRRHTTEDGYVQQHILRGVAPDGTEIAAPACLIVTLRDDQIVRIDEYLDSAHIRALVP